MPILKDGQVLLDNWVVAADDGPLPPGGELVVSKKRFSRERDELLASNTPIGLSLNPGDTLDGLETDFARFQLIAITFPKYTDGRPYSLAHLLRARHGYAGELRAAGDVLPDQITFMRRSGFDSFSVSERYVDKTLALLARPLVDLHYQPGATEEHATGYSWRRGAPKTGS